MKTKKTDRTKHVRAVASYGFQHGFGCALAWAKGLAEYADDPQVKSIAAVMAEELEKSAETSHNAFLDALRVAFDPHGDVILQ